MNTRNLPTFDRSKLKQTKRKPSLTQTRLPGVGLPNTYILLDVFATSFGRVGAACKFRLLCRQANAFLLSNKEYLYDKEEERNQLFSFKSLADISYSLPFECQAFVVSLHKDKTENPLSDEAFKAKKFSVALNPKAFKKVQVEQVFRFRDDPEVQSHEEDKSTNVLKIMMDSETQVQITNKLLYPPYVADPYFFKENPELSDLGNSKMDRVPADTIMTQLASLQMLGFHYFLLVHSMFTARAQNPELKTPHFEKLFIEKSLIKWEEDVLSRYSSQFSLPPFLEKFMVANSYSFHSLIHLSLVFKTVAEFQNFLLLHQDVQKSLILPEKLEVLTLKLDFLETKIDEYYSDHLLKELLLTPGLRDLGIELSSLNQISIFESVFKNLGDYPGLTHFRIKNQGPLLLTDGEGVPQPMKSQDEFPLYKVKEGFSKLHSLQLSRVPLHPMDFKGMLGKIHTNTPCLTELDLNDCFVGIELLDMREYLTQNSILTNLTISNQWLTSDQTFCGYFGHLQELKISLKHFSFIKRIKFPATLRLLDVKLEALSQTFLSGIREMAFSECCLEELLLTFNKIDESEGPDPAVVKKAEEFNGLQHPLKRLSLNNQLRNGRITFSQLYAMVLDPSLQVPFTQLEHLCMRKIKLDGAECSSLFRGFVSSTALLTSLKLAECPLKQTFTKGAATLCVEESDLLHLDIDVGYQSLLVGDSIKKLQWITPKMETLRVRGCFDSPQAVTHLLRQIEPGFKLFKIEVDYLGMDSFQAQNLRSIKELLASSRANSLKAMTLKVPRELFKMNFKRSLRASDFNKIQIFKLLVFDD